MTIDISGLIDDAKCYQMIRDMRWPKAVACPHCESSQVVKNGHDTHEIERQRYLCRGCGRSFDDLTHTVFAGHHQPLKVWMLCSYFMGLNLSNRQIAHELGLSDSGAHGMTKKLRQGVVDRQEPIVLDGIGLWPPAAATTRRVSAGGRRRFHRRSVDAIDGRGLV